MMKTKLKFLMMFLGLMVEGVNVSWADSTYEYYRSGDNLVNTNGKFSCGTIDVYTDNGFSASTTIANGSTINIDYAIQINSSDKYVSFTTSATSTVVIGMIVTVSGDREFHFDSNSDAGYGLYRNSIKTYTFNNVSAGTHTIASNTGGVGVYYVKVVEQDVNYSRTWDFTTDWGITATQLASSYWVIVDGTNNTVVSNLWNWNNATLIHGTGNSNSVIAKTDGLLFTGNKPHVKLNPGNWIQVDNATIAIDNLPASVLITITTTSVDGGISSVENLSGRKIDGVYKYVVNEQGTVRFNFVNTVQITKIEISNVDPSSPFLAFSKKTDTYNLVNLSYEEPALTVLPVGTSVTYSTSDPSIAKINTDNSAYPGDLMIINTGTVRITATAANGATDYYDLTVIANEAVWDVRNTYECYFPASNTMQGALAGNDNTGKLLVRRVTSVPHMTMEFGDASNNNVTMVTFRNGNRAANLIDDEGWQQVAVSYTTNNGWMIVPTQGTFYKFQPSVSGKLTIKGSRKNIESDTYGANTVVLVDASATSTYGVSQNSQADPNWDSYDVANNYRTRFYANTELASSEGNYYSYPILKTLSFDNNAYAVNEEEINLVGGHTYYLYANTPRTRQPDNNVAGTNNWQTFYLEGFIYETDFHFEHQNVIMGGGTVLNHDFYHNIPNADSFTQTIKNEGFNQNKNITYSFVPKGGISADIDASTGALTNISGSGALVVTASLTENGVTTKTSYVLTVPYTDITNGGTKEWVFNIQNYNYNGGNWTGTNSMETVAQLKQNAPESEWAMQYKVREYNAKTSALQYINVPVLTNALDVVGDNARYIDNTAGLLIKADSKTFGTTCSIDDNTYKNEGGVVKKKVNNEWVTLTSSEDIDIALKTMLNYDASHARDNCFYLTLENGASLTIPNLKAGQYVRIKWSRYSDGHGDKVEVTNLNDLDGNSITEPITVGAGGNVDRNGGTGYHEFIVKENGDVTIKVSDDASGWVNIHRIKVDNSFIPTELELKETTGWGVDNKGKPKEVSWQTVPTVYYRQNGETFSQQYTANYGGTLSQSNSVISYTVKANSGTSTLAANMPTISQVQDAEHDNYVFNQLNIGATGHGRFTLIQDGRVKSTSSDTYYTLDRREYEIKVYESGYTVQSYPRTWNLMNVNTDTGNQTLSNLTTDAGMTENNVSHQYKYWTASNSNKDFTMQFEPENLIAWNYKSSIDQTDGTVIPELNGLGIRPKDLLDSNGDLLSSNTITFKAGDGGQGIMISPTREQILTVPNVGNDQFVYLRVKNGSNPSVSAKFTSNGITATDNLETVLNSGGYTTYKAVGGGKEENNNTHFIDFYLKDVTIEQVAVSVDTKQISDAGYATEARGYNLDFSLNETFGGSAGALTANKVIGVNGTQVTLGSVTTPYFPAKQDKTGMVKNEHTGWGGTGMAGTWAAPAVNTSDGRNTNMVEHYNASTANDNGVIMSQTVSGLDNGNYLVELYANAMFTPGRGIESDMADGATDVAYVFANNSKAPITAHIADRTTENGFYELEVEVTNGTLTLGLGKYKEGTNWHTIQIKRLYKIEAQGVLLKGNQGDYPLFTWDVNRVTSNMNDNKLIGVWEVTNDTPVLPQKDADGNYNYILANGGALVKYVFSDDNGNIDNTTGTQTDNVSGLGFYLVIKAGTHLSDGDYVAEQPKVNSAYLRLSGDYLKVHATPESNSPVRQIFFIDQDGELTFVKSVTNSGSSIPIDDDGYYSLQGIRMDNPSKGIYLKGGKKIVIK